MQPQSSRLANGRTRRRLLRAGSAVLATGITTSTTGCLSDLPPLGREQTYGRVDVPPADEPAYRRWLPAPATFEDGGSHYRVTYVEPSSIAGDEPEEFVGRRAVEKASVDHFGIGFEEYDAYLNCDLGTVIEAEFDVSAVANALAQNGYEPDGSYRGYELFARSDVPRRAAVREGTVVWSSRRVHNNPDVGALVDTAAGDRQRYHDASPSFERITDAIGASRLVVVGPSFGGLTADAELAAVGFRFADGAAYQVVDLLFPDGAVPTVDRFARDVRGVEELTDEAEVFDAEIDGRLATIETRLPRRGGGEPSPFADPPQVTWGASYDGDAERLTIHHEAGDEIDTDLLWADIVTESTLGGAVKPLWEQRDRVGPGDSDTVDLRTVDLPDYADTNEVGSIPRDAKRNATGGSATPDRSGDPDRDTVDLGSAVRVAVVLAEHRSFQVGDWRRLFAYAWGDGS